MIRKFLFAIAVLAVSPAFVFSQDVFIIFENGDVSSSATTADGSGSAFIFSRLGFDFDAIDIDITNSDSSVIQFTGGELFNEVLTDGSEGTRFTIDPLIEISTSSPELGRLFAVHFEEITNSFGVKAELAMFDQGFDPTVGPEGSFLLGRVDFDIVGEGTATLEMVDHRASNPILLLPQTQLNTEFGSATFTVGSAPVVVGDANLDGNVGFDDILPFVSVLSASAFQAEVDCNQDGACNFRDIPPFIVELSGN